MAYLAMVNPKKRRARKSTKARRTARKSVARRTRRANPIVAHKRRRVSRRRNPVNTTAIMGKITGALAGAGGALILDKVYDVLPLPDAAKTGWGQVAGKLAAAVALGVVAEKVAGRKPMIAQGVMGAMTVTMFKAADSLMQGKPLDGGWDSMSMDGYDLDFSESSMGGILPAAGPLPATGPIDGGMGADLSAAFAGYDSGNY